MWLQSILLWSEEYKYRRDRGFRFYMWIARSSFSQGSWTEKKKTTKVNDNFRLPYHNFANRETVTIFGITRWSKEASFCYYLGCEMLICMHSLPIHLWTSQILPRNLFCCKKSTFLAMFLALIYCTWICFEYFLFNVICRVDDYIYDGNKDDLDASNDADFSLKSCSKPKKKSSKKVQI